MKTIKQLKSIYDNISNMSDEEKIEMSNEAMAIAYQFVDEKYPLCASGKTDWKSRDEIRDLFNYMSIIWMYRGSSMTKKYTQ